MRDVGVAKTEPEGCICDVHRQGLGMLTAQVPRDGCSYLTY